MRLTMEDHDRHPWLWVLAVAGLVIGGALAIFGLPPVDLHGPLHYVGVMDPFCGGTRGVQAMLQGDVRLAWRYNPLSVVLVAGAAGVLVRHVVGLASRRWITIRITRRRPTLIIVLALAVVLQVNQQAHAELLMTPGQRFSPLLMVVNVAAAVAAVLVVRWWFRRRTGLPPG